MHGASCCHRNPGVQILFDITRYRIKTQPTTDALMTHQVRTISAPGEKSHCPFTNASKPKHFMLTYLASWISCINKVKRSWRPMSANKVKHYAYKIVRSCVMYISIISITKDFTEVISVKTPTTILLTMQQRRCFIQTIKAKYYRNNN